MDCFLLAACLTGQPITPPPPSILDAIDAAAYVFVDANREGGLAGIARRLLEEQEKHKGDEELKRPQHPGGLR